ncbi:MAG: SpoIIE family protein phosphatase [Candidatus Altimarinota bacterium]
MLIKGALSKAVIRDIFLVNLFLLSLLLLLAYLNLVNLSYFYNIAAVAGTFLLGNLTIYYLSFVKPLEVVLFQVKALLTGRSYKKILTKRTDEVGVLANFFNEVTDSFEKLSKELKEGEKVSGELKTAGQLQRELIPNTAPTVPGFDIAVKNRSAEELGGDNFDFIKTKDSYYFYIGDVTGHGVPAAIVMTMVNTLINAFAEIFETAYEVVVQTNRRVKTRIKATMFMSMLMLKWNMQENRMTYIGCGHEHLVIYRANSGKCEVAVSGGIALGMVADNSKIVKEKEIGLNPGDIIVLYSDGVTEAKNMQGEMFGLKRLVEIIELYASQGDAQDLVQNIAKDFSHFVEEHVQEDDITLIALRKLGVNEKARSVMDKKQARWNENLEDIAADAKEQVETSTETF